MQILISKAMLHTPVLRPAILRSISLGLSMYESHKTVREVNGPGLASSSVLVSLECWVCAGTQEEGGCSSCSGAKGERLVLDVTWVERVAHSACQWGSLLGSNV